MNKLQLELENIKKLHKETTDNYKNEIEKAREAEEKLFKEVRVQVFLHFVNLHNLRKLNSFLFT